MACPVFTDSGLVRAIFKKFDHDKSGHLEEAEFKRVFHLLGIGRQHSDTIFKIIDKDDSKSIDCDELLNWLYAAESTEFVGDSEGVLETSQHAAGKMRSYQEILEEDFELGKRKRKSKAARAREVEKKKQEKEAAKEVDAVLRVRMDLDNVLSEELKKQFQAYDIDGNLNISLDELIEVAKAMESVTGSSRSEKEITDQAKVVFRSMDKDRNGRIDVKEYVKALLSDAKNESATNEEAYARVCALTETISDAVRRVKGQKPKSNDLGELIEDALLQASEVLKSSNPKRHAQYRHVQVTLEAILEVLPERTADYEVVYATWLRISDP